MRFVLSLVLSAANVQAMVTVQPASSAMIRSVCPQVSAGHMKAAHRPIRDHQRGVCSGCQVESINMEKLICLGADIR
jgi:hypothetical protein